MIRHNDSSTEYRECIVERAPQNRWMDIEGGKPPKVVKEKRAYSKEEIKKEIALYRKFIRDQKRKKRIEVLEIAIGTVICGIFAVIFLLPIILTITNSFMSASEINSNYGAIFATTSTGGKVFISKTVNLKFIPDIITLSQYYVALFKSPAYLFKFWNSVIYVVPIVVFQLAVSSLASYGFARYTGKVKGVIFFFYVIIMMMPYRVTLVPNYLVSEYLNILDTRWSIWLPGIFSPFAVYMLTKFMRRIPVSVLEAARIDGANEWSIFTNVAMPLCKGGIVSIAILIFID